MITDVLADIQSKINVPKNQRNEFGKYNYRSLEDILMALKPLLAAHKATVSISDDIVLVGERYYVKSTATLSVGGEQVSCTGWAREADDRKGMDSSQVTGSTSSYARKYAANGLFAIDDNKDADATNKHGADDKANGKAISAAQVKELETLVSEVGADKAAFCKFFQINKLSELTAANFSRATGMLESKRKGAK